MRPLRRSAVGGPCGLRVAFAAVFLGLAGPALAEIVRVEQVGTAVVGSTWGDLRQLAVDRGIGRAIVEVARNVSGRPPEDPAGDLRTALGGDLAVYAERFRVLEDRGTIPGTREDGSPTGDRRYTVLMEVYVDRDRVERRLRERGLMAPAPAASPAGQLRIEVRGVTSHADLEALKAFLVGPGGAQSVVPREFERGRVWLAVQTRHAPAELVWRIHREAPAELRLRGVRVEDGAVVVELN